MASEPDGGIEFLDVGPDPSRSLPSARPKGAGHRRPWWLLAVAAVVLALIGFAVSRGSDGPPAAHGSPASAPHSAGTPVRALPTPAGPGGLPEVIDVGHPILGIGGGWQLIARGEDRLVRIEFGRGRVDVTELPTLNTTGRVSLVAGSADVLIRPLDYVPGYVVADGRAAATPPRALSRGPVFPGPLPDQVWVPTGTGAVGSGDSVRVLGFDGRPRGQTFALPGGVQSASLVADGAGGLAFSGVGGLYRLRPDGWHRLSPGALLAVGPTRMLVQECDPRYRCRPVVIRQSDGARLTSLSARVGGDAQAGPGTTSPDGRTAALPFIDETGLDSIHLVDLATGAVRVTKLTLDSEAGDDVGAMAWSPDSRWLFAVTNGESIAALDVASGRVRDLGVRLPSVVQLAVRPQAT